MDGDAQLDIIIPALRAVAAGIGAEQLGAGTPCASFDVSGVLAHMTGLGSAFGPMFLGEEPPADRPVEPGTELARFDEAMAGLLLAVRTPGAMIRTITTPGGPMPGAVFARLVAFDGTVHGWDLASSTGQAWDLPDSLVEEVEAFAHEAITDDMRDGDAFALAQSVGEGATPLQRLVAFSGRAA